MADTEDPSELEQSARRLLDAGLLTPAPPRTERPARESLLFFDGIPAGLLRERYHALQNGAQIGEWFLFTDSDDPSWLEPMRGDFGVIVGVLDDEDEVKAVRARLLEGRRT